MKLHHLLPLLALLLVGCGAKDQAATGPDTTTPPTAEKKVLKVALLTPGQVNDAGWSALAYDGLQAIHTELGADVANDVATDAKIKDAMRSYAQKGYDLIIGHGFEYNKPGVELAKDFPKTVFVSSSGGETAPNAGAFRFYLEQGCYLAGYVAGKMTKTGVIGSVAVQNFPSIVSTIKAYEDGARAANPKVKIIPTVYFATEGDVAKAKQATEAVLAQHADFIIHQANDAAIGVFQACKEGHAFAFGTNANQNDNDSGIVLASATIIARPAFLDLAKQVQAGTYKGGVNLIGMEKGAIDFVFNPELFTQVPPDVMRSIDELKVKIRSGALVVPKDNF